MLLGEPARNPMARIAEGLGSIRVPACGVRRLAEQGFPAGRRKLHASRVRSPMRLPCTVFRRILRELSQHSQALGHCVRQRARTVAADFRINAFEPPD